MVYNLSVSLLEALSWQFMAGKANKLAFGNGYLCPLATIDSFVWLIEAEFTK